LAPHDVCLYVWGAGVCRLGTHRLSPIMAGIMALWWHGARLSGQLCCWHTPPKTVTLSGSQYWQLNRGGHGQNSPDYVGRTLVPAARLACGSVEPGVWCVSTHALAG